VVLAAGRLVNLGAAEGHPPAVMDMSFAGQALTLAWLTGKQDGLTAGVLDVPEDVDDEVARMKLAGLGRRIDELTDEQRHYLASYDIGT